jgi:hypothetical protein
VPNVDDDDDDDDDEAEELWKITRKSVRITDMWANI